MAILRAARSTLLSVAIVCGGCRQAAPRALTGASSAVESGPDWQAWSPAAFARARREHKLILVSLQAGFCHWCHVMDATTYRDARVLRLLREHFVVLRADEAARPDLRERYAAWGWPATALLTPDAEAIVNLRGHQPAAQFAALLEQLVGKLQRGEVLSDVTPAKTSAENRSPVALTAMRERAQAQLAAAYETREGGWGSPQKYPFPAPVEHALWRAAVHGDGESRERAVHSLLGYAQLIDPVAGGMFQYSLEGVWTAPHYEKLASIQAGAIATFSAAYRATGDATLLAHAQRLASYVLTTLRTPDGAFYASQEADVGHVGLPGYLAGQTYYALSAADRTSVAAPAVDPHVYANLNGQLISALCELYRADHDARWLSAAQTAMQTVQRLLLRGDGFVHAPDDATRVFYLSDQVELIVALRALSRASFAPALDEQAKRTLLFTERVLQDQVHGGFYARTADETATGVFSERDKPYDDNAKLARVLLTLSHVEDEPSYRTAAERALTELADARGVAARGRQVGEYLLALEQLSDPYVMFSVVGLPDDPGTRALFDAAWRAYLPQGIVAFSPPETSRYPYRGRPAVYLCSDNACSSPVFTADLLAAALAAFVSAAE